MVAGGQARDNRDIPVNLYTPFLLPLGELRSSRLHRRRPARDHPGTKLGLSSRDSGSFHADPLVGGEPIYRRGISGIVRGDQFSLCGDHLLLVRGIGAPDCAGAYEPGSSDDKRRHVSRGSRQCDQFSPQRLCASRGEDAAQVGDNNLAEVVLSEILPLSNALVNRPSACRKAAAPMPGRVS